VSIRSGKVREAIDIMLMFKNMKCCDIYENYLKNYYEHLFGIQTCGRLYLNNRPGQAIYEPTPYRYLVSYFRKHPFEKGKGYVDFGCGMGRTVFLAAHFGCTQSIGVDVNVDMYNQAVKNRSHFEKKRKQHEEVSFFHCPAESFLIKDSYCYFYFFNPFHLKYFIKTINNILRSYQASPRKIRLILYYVAEEYIRYLSKQTEFQLLESIFYREGACFQIYTIKASNI